MSNEGHYSEESGYCNIHGEDITVLVCQKTGRFAVPLDEIRGTGFRLYRKIQYSRLLVDDIQFNKEFDLHMLQSAQTYLLEHKVAFKENEILASIDKVKRILIDKQTGNRTPNINASSTERSPQNLNQNATLDKPNHGAFPKSVRGDLSSPQFRAANAHARNQDSSPQSFMRGHTVEGSSDSITVTANLRQPRTPITFQNNAGFKPRSSLEPEKGRSSLEPERGRGSLEPENGRGGFEARKGRNGLEPPQKARNTSELNKSSGSRGSLESLNSNKANGEENGDMWTPHKLTKPVHTLLITHLERHNYHAQDVDNADVLLKIDALINSEIRNKPETPTRAIWGKMYLGMDPDDNNWYRCRVIKFKPLVAYFVDYGNRTQIQMSDLREVTTEELANIPFQAVKITFASTCQKKPTLSDTVTVAIQEVAEGNKAYVVDYADAVPKPADAVPKPADAPQPASPPKPASSPQAAAKPAAPTFFAKPAPLCELADGQRVMIVGHDKGRIALRTKESYDVLKRIEGALSVAVTTAVETVQKGQLVICEKEKLQRAVVVDVQKNRAEVELLDCCGTITVDLSTLKHISGSLAKQPLTYLMTPPIRGYSEAADEKLRELVEKKAKATVIISKGEVDLNLVDGPLSALLQPTRSDLVMLKNLTAWSPPMGADEYNLNVYFDESAAYFSSMEVQEDFLNFILLTDLDDSEPYAPIEGEVCLGNYQGSWSRCVILGIKNGTYSARFIDFGNVDELDSENLRKLPENCKSVPILAFKCRLTGYPENRLQQLNKKMKDQEEKNLKVIVKKFNGVSYEIEVPEIYNSLA